MRVGVDTGGTFTDCVTTERGRIKILKVFSAPNAAEAILGGVGQLIGPAYAGPGLLEIIHGTTLGTNTLLERRGARVALVTTAGFEDLIEIGRQARPRLYDLNVQRDPPLVERELRWGVDERVAADSRLLRRPKAQELARLRSKIRRSRAESIAVCFLFSFANRANERVVARALRSLGRPLSVSHEVLAEFREYERLSTTVINAYLAPRVGEYLLRLERLVQRRKSKIENRKSEGRLLVMQSNGGIMTAVRAAHEPARTILSGPAGGVVAARWLTKLLGTERVISFDMGGTSTDVCLIHGRAETTHETVVGGLPVAVPMLDIHSVGAGGGSIARLDRAGALRVGPESAGTWPGAICYARGGTRPTVTDAHVLLGRLDPEHFLGGTFHLDMPAAQEGFQEFLRRQPAELRRSGGSFSTPAKLARGIIAVANTAMEKALRVISIERGYDPRDFSLVSFGGAGGLHAADLARALRFARVIVPPHPGAFSALGVLISDVVKDVSQSVLLPVPAEIPGRLQQDLERRFEQLERTARAEVRREGLSAPVVKIERRVDVRYVGQSYELSVPWTPAFQREFHREHERAYGTTQPGRPIEIVTLRLRLIIPTPKAWVRRRPAPKGFNPRAAWIKQRQVWFDKSFRVTPFYERSRLEPGARLKGPSVVQEYSSTILVPPDFVCTVDEYLNLILVQISR